jgi:hypothetical protein
MRSDNRLLQISSFTVPILYSPIKEARSGKRVITHFVRFDKVTSRAADECQHITNWRIVSRSDE